MKRLFDANDEHTNESVELCRRMEDLLIPIFQEMRERGYSTREVCYIIQESANVAEITHRLSSRNR